MLSLVLSAALLGTLPDKAVPVSTPDSIPTVLISRDNQQAIAPDWSVISFSNLPALTLSGSYNSRYWNVGQTLDQVLTLEDFADSFKLQDLNLYAIALATRTPRHTVHLSQFKLLQRQTLADLAEALPELKKVSVSEVKPLADLLKSAKPSYQLAEETLPQLLTQDPTLGALSFHNFDLSSYMLEDIPGLLQAPLQAFKGWQQARIEDIPDLNRMPWSQFPDPPQNDGLVGVVQLPTGAITNWTESISGSNVVGYQVPCPQQSSCSGITFSNPPLLQGKQWISGDAQWVAGEAGEMGQPMSYQEPTGRNVFGKAFKVVVTDITSEEVTTTLYFRFCESKGNQAHCSPYQVGAVPFLRYHTGDAMLVGTVERQTTDNELSHLGEAIAPTDQQTTTIPESNPSVNGFWFRLFKSLRSLFSHPLQPIL